MSQAATLYQITQSDFLKIKALNGKEIKPSDFTNYFATFQSSFMALEYLLSKGLDQDKARLIEEIFNPSQDMGSVDHSNIDFEKMREEEMWSILDSVDYIEVDRVNEINNLLLEISENEGLKNYNAEELNFNDVYPYVWQNGDSDDIFNSKYILEELRSLKKFFSESANSRHLILVYVG